MAEFGVISLSPLPSSVNGNAVALEVLPSRALAAAELGRIARHLTLRPPQAEIDRRVLRFFRSTAE